MSKFLTLSVIVLSVAAFADDMEPIRQALLHGAETQIEVTVVHEDGTTVAGAEVSGMFPSIYDRDLAKIRYVLQQTDVNGRARLQARSGGDVLIEVSKAGYYVSREVVFFNTGKPSCVKEGRWQPWGYPCKIVLKPKMFPRKLTTNWAQRLFFLVPGEPGDKIGFDLERNDWVTPYGKGVVTDFLVSSQMKKEGLPEGVRLRQELNLYFPKAADGAYRAPISTQSYLQTPHKADPNARYEKELQFWRDVEFAVNAKMSENALEKECLILRTRTVCDVSGKIISAHYAVIDAPLILCERPDNEIHLFYFYNPTPNDPWLESERRATLKGRTLRGAKRW